MIQDIFPSRLDNSYKALSPCEEDTVFDFDSDGRLLVRTEDGRIMFPAKANLGIECARYLFSIDDVRYFLAGNDSKAHTEPEGYSRLTIRQLRDISSGSGLFAAFTAYHLWRWYADNEYCGVCGGKLSDDDKERARRCGKCGKIIYLRINPAVIVGVINGESLLITRYKRGYAHNALIAGFAEIGETLEETVSREVMEEAGIRVKNIRYYKSQPWGMAQDILVGFYCEADGDTDIRMDEGELKYAAWTKRDEIELQPNDLSLTNEMMRMFKENSI